VIYQSSAAFKRSSLEEINSLLQNTNIKSLELSGGPYQDDLEQKLNKLKKNFNLALHNYYPVPKVPFVFNLSTQNEELREICINHAKKSIDLSSSVGSDIYSFHAGFLLDPKPEDLGNLKNNLKQIDRNTGLNNFFKNLHEIAAYAATKGVKIMIENNVVSRSTYERFNGNPLLLSEPEEAKIFVNSIPSNVYFLCDYAHLKVSSKSIDFPSIKFLEIIESHLIGAHLSDNNGIDDQNIEFTEKAWFFDVLPKDLDYYSIEVYKSEVSLLEKCNTILKNFLEND
tara:strand:- start:31 stop:882 length:852 start_codon:yes stop_codon:yes gene_type:complete